MSLISSDSADGVVHTHGSLRKLKLSWACGVPFRRSPTKKVKWLEGQEIRAQRLAGSSTFGWRLIRCWRKAQQMVYSIR